jgi:hypothetical protein
MGRGDLLSGSNIPHTMCQPGLASTGMCYASPTIWTYVCENNYMQQNMCGRCSNFRPPALDTMLEDPL